MRRIGPAISIKRISSDTTSDPGIDRHRREYVRLVPGAAGTYLAGPVGEFRNVRETRKRSEYRQHHLGTRDRRDAGPPQARTEVRGTALRRRSRVIQQDDIRTGQQLKLAQADGSRPLEQQYCRGLPQAPHRRRNHLRTLGATHQTTPRRILTCHDLQQITYRGHRAALWPGHRKVVVAANPEVVDALDTPRGLHLHAVPGKHLRYALWVVRGRGCAASGRQQRHEGRECRKQVGSSRHHDIELARLGRQPIRLFRLVVSDRLAIDQVCDCGVDKY